MASGDIGQLFRKFAVPGILGLLFIGMQPMVDGAVLGNFVGADALTGLNLFVPIYTFMSASAVVVGIGCQTIVSIALGSKEYARANNALRSAFLFLLSYSLIMTVAGLVFAEQLSRLLGANDSLAGYTAEYIRTFSPFFPFLTLLFLGDYMLKATGKPFFALFVLGSVQVLNALLNLLFVGIFGWGINGAALATGIALFTACMVMLPSMTGKNNIVNIRRGRMKQTLFMGFWTNALIGAVFFCLIFFGGESIIRLFFNEGEGDNIANILSIASNGASIIAFAFVLNGANILSSSYFTSMGDARTSVVISLLRGLVLIAAGILVWPSYCW